MEKERKEQVNEEKKKLRRIYLAQLESTSSQRPSSTATASTSNRVGF
jgi:hypothetical protein